MHVDGPRPRTRVSAAARRAGPRLRGGRRARRRQPRAVRHGLAAAADTRRRSSYLLSCTIIHEANEPNGVIAL